MNMQLTKSPIGLDGIPAAETVLEPCRWRTRRTDHRRRTRRRPRRARPALRASPRGCGAAEPVSRPARPTSAPPWARPANAPLPGLPDLLRATRGLSIVDGFRAAIAGLRAESGARSRGDDRRCVSGDCRRAGAACQRQRSCRARSEHQPRRRHADDAARPQARPARGGRARCLFRHGVRSRHECIDVHDARRGLDAGRPVRGRHRRILRADRTAARRRAGAGAGNARCDRHAASASSHGSTRARARRTADGLRPPRLSGPRSARRCAESAIERLAADGADLPFAGEVEAYIREALRRENPDRPLETNVEFFTAILLDALAIPRQAFTPIFAVARAAGWTAHAREQQRTGRLIRPSSSYIGPVPSARIWNAAPHGEEAHSRGLETPLLGRTCAFQLSRTTVFR